MVPQTQARKASNSSKVNLVISLVFHGVLVFVVLYFAARSGILGKKAQNLLVYKVKEQAPKPKEPEKKADQPKPDDTPKPVVVPKITTTQPNTTPAASAPAPDASAPPPADVASFVFDGGRPVNSASPVELYQSLIQQTFTAHWHRPEMADKDKDFVAEMRVNIDSDGHVSNPVLEKSSGNPVWDNSVKQAVADTRQLSRMPPKGFPDQVKIRFDVAEEKQDSLFQ